MAIYIIIYTCWCFEPMKTSSRAKLMATVDTMKLGGKINHH